MNFTPNRLRVIADGLAGLAKDMQRLADADPALRSKLLPYIGTQALDKDAPHLRKIADEIETDEARAEIAAAIKARCGMLGIDDAGLGTLRELWTDINALGSAGTTTRGAVLDHALAGIETRIGALVKPLAAE